MKKSTLACAAIWGQRFVPQEEDFNIIDIHQHTNYAGRSHEELLTHQRAMGVKHTILLPAGTPSFGASTHFGKSNGLQVNSTGNDVCMEIAGRYPGEFYFGANEVPDLQGADKEIEKYLKKGAKAIGELKFGVKADGKPMERIYRLAEAYNVPVLLHWQFGMYTYGYEDFHKILQKFPKVNFIGHAQSWWANIDKNHNDQSVLYPRGKVTPGGITDRLLADYPNMFADMSAGSGLSALTRDEEHARGFLVRHQDKLLYGSDCDDRTGTGNGCTGIQAIQKIKELSPDLAVVRKILHGNAAKLFRI
ncbi:amidohydrolase family protein [Ravibacter arvi]|uniref:amidohydrolase family protein n=1 Tax=Ravibacter arvi TaxID=2051041 RepID=UPI0031F0826F